MLQTAFWKKFQISFLNNERIGLRYSKHETFHSAQFRIRKKLVFLRNVVGRTAYYNENII